MHAYAGKTLRVDLGRQRVREEPIDPAAARAFIGGRGLATKIIHDEVNPKVEPLAGANKLILATGPLTGTSAMSGGRFMAVTKGALTGAIACSNCGGNFGPELKFAGYDLIVLEGTAKKPVVIIIDDDRVEVRPAGKLWGKNVHETEDALHEQLGGDFKCVSIGPAGEKLVRFANIMNDKNRAAGRSGVGAVMGSKKVKAIAVRGSGGLTAADPKLSRAACLDSLDKLQAGAVTGQGFPRY